MKNNLIHNKLEKVDGYLINIERNIDNSSYELAVGFRKNWVFKSNNHIECKITSESNNGTLVTISGKHDEVTVDDLIDYVIKVIETNKKITEMQKRHEEEIEKKKEKFAEELLKFEEELEKYKESSFSENDIEKDLKEKEEVENGDKFDDLDETTSQKINK